MKRQANYNIKEFCNKLLQVCLGVILAACGISMFYTLNIGSDPISVFVDGQHRIFGMNYGTINLLNSMVYFIFILIFDRKQIRLATLIAGFGMGPLINLFTGIFSRFVAADGSFTIQIIDFRSLAFLPPGGDYLLRLMMLLPAVILLGCGLGLYLSADMGAAPVDAMVLFLSEKLKRPFKEVKILCDLVMAVLGLLLGGILGVGTIAAIILTGPMISLTMHVIKRHKGKHTVDKVGLADA